MTNVCRDNDRLDRLVEFVHTGRRDSFSEVSAACLASLGVVHFIVDDSVADVVVDSHRPTDAASCTVLSQVSALLTYVGALHCSSGISLWIDRSIPSSLLTMVQWLGNRVVSGKVFEKMGGRLHIAKISLSNFIWSCTRWWPCGCLGGGEVGEAWDPGEGGTRSKSRAAGWETPVIITDYHCIDTRTHYRRPRPQS